MAVIKIQHIAFLLFISGLATVNGGDSVACTVEEVEVCGNKLQGVDKSKLCDGVLDEAQKCWDEVFLSCDETDEQTAAKTQAVEGIVQSKAGCPKPTQAESADTSCSAEDVDKCKTSLATVEGVMNFCRAWESRSGCFKNLTLNCLNETVKGDVEQQVKDMEKKFGDEKCCSAMKMSECGEDRVVVTNTTASKESCKKLQAGKECLEKMACEEKDMLKSINEGLEEMDGFLAICEKAGYKISDDDGSGNAIQPTLVLLLSAFVCALYGLYV